MLTVTVREDAETLIRIEAVETGVCSMRGFGEYRIVGTDRTVRHDVQLGAASLARKLLADHQMAEVVEIAKRLAAEPKAD